MLKLNVKRAPDVLYLFYLKTLPFRCPCQLLSIFQPFFLEIDEMKKNEAKLFEDVERAKNEKRSAETTLEEILKSRRNEDRNGEINQLQIRYVFKFRAFFASATKQQT